MRHRVAGSRLNRSMGHRTAMRRALVTDLFRHARIQTTEATAKAIRGQAEKLRTLAKRGLAVEETIPERGVHARRLAAGRLNDPEIVQKLFDELGPRYVERPGGYTRIIKLGPRKGDAARMAVIELVEE